MDLLIHAHGIPHQHPDQPGSVKPTIVLLHYYKTKKEKEKKLCFCILKCNQTVRKSSLKLICQLSSGSTGRRGHQGDTGVTTKDPPDQHRSNVSQELEASNSAKELPVAKLPPKAWPLHQPPKGQANTCRPFSPFTSLCQRTLGSERVLTPPPTGPPQAITGLSFDTSLPPLPGLKVISSQ